MENLKWRNWTKKVAYADSVLTAISLLVGILNTVCNFYGAVNQKLAIEQVLEADEDGVNKMAVKIGILFHFTIGVIGTWGSVNLMNSTDEDRDPKEAYGMLCLYRNLSFCLSLFSTMLSPTFQFCFASGFYTVWRCILFFSILKYIEEMDELVYPQNG